MRFYKGTYEIAMKLSIEQIAAALDLPTSKVERWIRQGRIPLTRTGFSCDFDREALTRWAAQHNLRFCPEGEPEPACGLAPAVNLLNALKQGGVHYGLAGENTAEVLQAAVARIACVPEESRANLVAKLLEREALSSTGLGRGVAVPHPREPELSFVQSPCVAACFLAAPVDFDALDGKPVRTLFVLLAPDVRAHLQILSRLSFCLRNTAFSALLDSRPEPNVLLETLNTMEKQWEQAEPL
jgi:PTS system nitrogen regulatory IIA component